MKRADVLVSGVVKYAGGIFTVRYCEARESRAIKFIYIDQNVA